MPQTYMGKPHAQKAPATGTKCLIRTTRAQMCRCCEGKVDATAADIGKLWIRKRQRCWPGLVPGARLTQSLVLHMILVPVNAPRLPEVARSRCKLTGMNAVTPRPLLHEWGTAR